MELIAFWLLLALVVGYGAAQKGRSGVAWFVLAVLLSPLIAGLFVLAMRADAKPVVARSTTQPAWGYPEKKPPPDHVATLASLADLRERGVLTTEEYDTKKAEVLARV